MNLILWRHAQAAEGGDDLQRELTAKGRKQAARAAEWLLQRLPVRFVLLVSPAVRAQQTAQALGMPFKTEKALAPGASPSSIIRAAGWPDFRGGGASARPRPHRRRAGVGRAGRLVDQEERPVVDRQPRARRGRSGHRARGRLTGPALGRKLFSRTGR
jgi:hypothetical protein